MTPPVQLYVIYQKIIPVLSLGTSALGITLLFIIKPTTHRHMTFPIQKINTAVQQKKVDQGSNACNNFIVQNMFPVIPHNDAGSYDWTVSYELKKAFSCHHHRWIVQDFSHGKFQIDVLRQPQITHQNTLKQPMHVCIFLAPLLCHMFVLESVITDGLNWCLKVMGCDPMWNFTKRSRNR